MATRYISLGSLPTRVAAGKRTESATPAKGQLILMDARPDRVDLRDRPYNPKLQNLDPQFPPRDWVRDHFQSYLDLILDQGKEGACTGFGLAACVNYLLWKRTIDSSEEAGFTKGNLVSPWMLYHLAKQYDEWDGDEYDGSSCRGAMKGWHKHGVTRYEYWAKSLLEKRPHEAWAIDAAERPLGSYYRVEKTSVADMQAAIAEVGAVYCSANVHEGWQLPAHQREITTDFLDLPMIPRKKGSIGGHAFAIVGYCRAGFVVQNSWGKNWGWNGFGVLGYDDWADHAMDAWVAVLGAPMQLLPDVESQPASASKSKSAKSRPGFQVPITRSNKSLQQSMAGMTRASYSEAFACELPTARLTPLSINDAYERAVVVGNNGTPLNRFVDEANGAAAVKRVVNAAIESAAACAKNLKTNTVKGDGIPRVVIYAHGGLNDEKDSIQRIRKMAPLFEANGIAPIFATWRTGIVESIFGWAFDKFEAAITPPRAENIFGRVITYLDEQKDRAIEGVAHEVMVRAIWSEMKQNAEAAASSGGIGLMLDQLLAARAKRNFELHVIGHSAGAILLGHVLQRLKRSDTVDSCTLYAPACTMDLARDSYLPALRSKKLKSLHVDVLSDNTERDDTVGPYGKSLLYLVSRALEKERKCPLMGMEIAWDNDLYTEGDLSWARSTWELKNVGDDLMKAGANRAVHHNTVEDNTKSLTATTTPRSTLAKLFRGEHVRMHVDGTDTTKLSHGSFDNDILVMDSTIRRILGRDTQAMLDDRTLSQRPALAEPVTDLTPMKDD
jgi:hypothetical protein